MSWREGDRGLQSHNNMRLYNKRKPSRFFIWKVNAALYFLSVKYSNNILGLKNSPSHTTYNKVGYHPANMKYMPLLGKYTHMLDCTTVHFPGTANPV